MRETLPKEVAMFWIIQPSRRAARMRQWDIGDAILHARTADGIFQRDLAPETLDRKTTEEKDHRGWRSASSSSSHGRQSAISADEGLRSPPPLGDFPGKHFVIAVR